MLLLSMEPRLRVHYLATTLIFIVDALATKISNGHLFLTLEQTSFQTNTAMSLSMLVTSTHNHKVLYSLDFKMETFVSMEINIVT